MKHFELEISPWHCCNSYLKFDGYIRANIWLLPKIKLEYRRLIKKTDKEVSGYYFEIEITWLCFLSTEISLRLAK